MAAVRYLPGWNRMVGIVMLVSLLAGRASADSADGLIASPEPDWPQWQGPHRDGAAREEKNLLPSWPENGPPLAWKIEELGAGWSSPIIVKDRLYITGDVGQDLVVYAFDLEGKPQWRTTNGKSWTGSFPGARACCAYSEGKLYHLNAHGRVACLAAATGKELWSITLEERFHTSPITWGLSECLLVDGLRLIVTPGGETALMAALDKQTGKTIWATEAVANNRVTHAAPILFRHEGRRILASCSSKRGFGVDADTGKLLWTVPVESPYGVNVASPIYHAGQILYVTPYKPGVCYRLSRKGDGLEAVEAWRTTLDTCTGTVFLSDGLLLGSGYQKHKSWLCLEWQTGKPKFEFKGVSTSSAVLADGRLYCMVEDGRAALLRPTADGIELAGQFRPIAKKSRDAWAHPVVLHGRLYLRYHNTLWCHDVRAR